MTIKTVAQATLKFAKNNAPVILTGIGVVGIGCTAFFAAKGTLKADKHLKELEDAGEKPETKWEIVKAVYPYYIPAGLSILVASGCVIGATGISLKQLATMTTVATTMEQALKENREKVQEVFGEKGLRKIDEKINESHAAKYFSDTGTIYETGHGSVLCCEGFLTGALFLANPEWIHKNVNDFNARLLDGEILSYNEFVQMVIPSFDQQLLPAAGDKFGYQYDINQRLLRIVMDSFITPDGRPGLIFTVQEVPMYCNEY